MIRGVGVDVVHIPRIAKALDRWGSRFLERLFAAREIAAGEERFDRARFFALRFAAKEAFVKAVGTGMRRPFRWHAVEVRNDSLGRPFIVLGKELESWCRDQRIERWHLSLSDDGDYAIAFVVVEGE